MKGCLTYRNANDFFILFFSGGNNLPSYRDQKHSSFLLHFFGVYSHLYD